MPILYADFACPYCYIESEQIDALGTPFATFDALFGCDVISLIGSPSSHDIVFLLLLSSGGCPFDEKSSFG